MSIYADDEVVAELTRRVLDTGCGIFQIFQRGGALAHIEFLLQRFNPPSGKVLDVGSGIGQVALRMTQARPDLQFTLLNISQSQLDMSPTRLGKIHADACDIPLPDNSMDAVMACYVLGHLDKDKALAEWRRVLRPGGVLFVVDITGGPIPELEYVAHEFGGEIVEGMNTRAFDKLMPDFKEKYPHIKPAIMREVKA